MKVILENSDGKSTLLDLLQQKGIQLRASCGGHGKCGKCRVIMNGDSVLACEVYPEGSSSVEIPENMRTEICSSYSDIDACGTGLGIAIDVGTTTVAAQIFDLSTGHFIKEIRAQNALASFGADVVSRIDAARDGKLRVLTENMQKQLNNIAIELCDGQPEKVSRAVMTGNTVMQHFCAGLNPVSISVPPFSPQSLFGYTKKFGNTEMVFPACVSGYVGSDLAAGLAAIGGAEAEGLWLYVDIGTNGEMALGNKDGYLCSATAAGPAFEDAEIECGAIASAGAIDHVKLSGGKYMPHVIGDGKAQGICGSGLIDSAACFLDNGDFIRSGRFTQKRKRIYLADEVYISQEDIRKLQFAKGAIRAGIETLLKECGCSYGDITKLVIAGGFGNYINIQSATRIGMIPPRDEKNIFQVGNASMRGAALALKDENFIAKMARKLKYLDLSSSVVFPNIYIEQLNFEN